MSQIPKYLDFRCFGRDSLDSNELGHIDSRRRLAEVKDTYIAMVGYRNAGSFVCAPAVWGEAIKRVPFVKDFSTFSHAATFAARDFVENSLHRPALVATLTFWLIAFNGSIELPGTEGRGGHRHA